MKTTLSIEKEIIAEIRDIPLQSQKIILDIVRLLKTGIQTSQKKHDITELRGEGKELWKGIDAQTYVNKLREDWS
jgi:mRNA-degrading endonuclease RelE of RelBE toxin-antitoxin system